MNPTLPSFPYWIESALWSGISTMIDDLIHHHKSNNHTHNHSRYHLLKGIVEDQKLVILGVGT